MHPKAVLFLDDNGKDLPDQSYQDYLQTKYGIRCILAGPSNPVATGLKFVQQSPEIIAVITDKCQHSDFSHITQLRNLRPSLRIALRSGRVTEEERVRALQAGADVCFLKGESLDSFLQQASEYAEVFHQIESAKMFRDWRRAIECLLHREIQEKSQAKFYTPFFIWSPDSHRDFWLIHLSGHYRARDVMVGLHWEQNTSFAHYGGSGLRMLGYDPEEDFSLTRQRILPGFYFDETARNSTHECLLDQLPEHLYEMKADIAFDELFASITNETLATSDLFREVVVDLVREGVIQIRDKKTGRRLRRIQRGSDIIIVERQKRLFLPWGQSHPGTVRRPERGPMPLCLGDLRSERVARSGDRPQRGRPQRPTIRGSRRSTTWPKPAA